ncbi:MAG: class I SAM-dependent methyltransferase [bacterium]|nr:class I SAM-dependent methyltransferase [bacterium]
MKKGRSHMSILHEIACPLCETQFLPERSVFFFLEYAVFTCPDCSTRFCRPFVDNRTLYTTALIQQKAGYLETTAQDLPAELLPYVQANGKNILDIGCGTGSFLKTLQEQHNSVFGLEISETYAPILTQKGIPHTIGRLEETLTHVPDRSYDLITLWDVFEHLEHPKEILLQTKKKLREGGVIINWTNNYDDYISRFAELTYRLSLGYVKLFMEKSFFSIPCSHNYNFTPYALKRLYERNGFQILQTIITDTPSFRLSKSLIFRGILETFYLANSISGKGKIICHVIKVI